jgi:hypothetical protein
MNDAIRNWCAALAELARLADANAAVPEELAPGTAFSLETDGGLRLSAFFNESEKCWFVGAARRFPENAGPVKEALLKSNCDAPRHGAGGFIGGMDPDGCLCLHARLPRLPGESGLMRLTDALQQRLAALEAQLPAAPQNPGLPMAGAGQWLRI